MPQRELAERASAFAMARAPISAVILPQSPGDQRIAGASQLPIAIAWTMHGVEARRTRTVEMVAIAIAAGRPTHECLLALAEAFGCPDGNVDIQVDMYEAMAAIVALRQARWRSARPWMKQFIAQYLDVLGAKHLRAMRGKHVARGGVKW